MRNIGRLKLCCGRWTNEKFNSKFHLITGRYYLLSIINHASSRHLKGTWSITRHMCLFKGKGHLHRSLQCKEVPSVAPLFRDWLCGLVSNTFLEHIVFPVCTFATKNIFQICYVKHTIHGQQIMHVRYMNS